MLSRITIAISILVLCSCATTKVPQGYVPRGKKAETNVYGSWIRITLNEDNEGSYERHYESGELLAIQYDTLYLSYFTSVKSFPTDSITKAVVFSHKYWGADPFMLGALAVIPNLIGIIAYNEYADGFISLGFYHIISATIATALNNVLANRIVYPTHVPYINMLHIYARFPQGIPPGIDPYSLKSLPLGI